MVGVILGADYHDATDGKRMFPGFTADIRITRKLTCLASCYPMESLTESARLRDITTELQSFAGDLGGWLRGGLERLSGNERRALAVRFAVWARQPQGIDDQALLAWIDDLGEPGRAALVEQLAVFCADFELDLAWLVDGQLTAWPQLETRLRRLVRHYCLACQAAVEADEDRQVFHRRQRWQSKLKAAATTTTAAET